MKQVLLLTLLLMCLDAQATFRPWYHEPGTYAGTSSDTKPVQNIKAGSKFVETDTNNVYRWTGDESQGTSADWDEVYEGVTLGTLISGEDQTNNVIRTESQFSYCVDDADIVCKSAAGFLHAVTCWPEDAAAIAGRVQIRDATAAGAGTVVWQDEFAAAEHTPSGAVLNVVMATGIVIDFDTTADVFCTVSYR